jgi:hypothetical protein
MTAISTRVGPACSPSTSPGIPAPTTITTSGSTSAGPFTRSSRTPSRDPGRPWAECHHEDRGDGVLIIIPPRIPGYLVIPHPSLVDPALFRPLNTRVKKTPVHGWIYVPGYQPP